jgi:hypothetical protein
MSREKIQPEHLARPAFVYVRQSTVDQVRHHHESRRRQYGLADHAQSLGWHDVVVIDDDLGKSIIDMSGGRRKPAFGRPAHCHHCYADHCPSFRPPPSVSP